MKRRKWKNRPCSSPYMLNESLHSAALIIPQIKFNLNRTGYSLKYIQCANNWRDKIKAASRTILSIDIFIFVLEKILSRTITVSYFWGNISSIHRFLSILVVSIRGRCANLSPREYVCFGCANLKRANLSQREK